MGKVQQEIEELINLGKKSGDMELKTTAIYAWFSLQADDGTPGLGAYLWKEEILPNLEKARKRAKYLHQTQCVVNTAGILAKRHSTYNRKNYRKERAGK